MQFKNLFIIAHLALLGVASVKGDQIGPEITIKQKVNEALESIFIHLGYSLYYLTVRSQDLAGTTPKLYKYSEQIQAKRDEVFKILGYEPNPQLPEVTTTLILDENFFKPTLLDYENLQRIETQVKSSLKILEESFEIWKDNFEANFGVFRRDQSKIQSANVYRILFSDLLIIFFEVANWFIKVQGVKLNKVNLEELYAKSIFNRGLFYFKETKLLSKIEGEPSLVLMTKRSNEGNLDLLGRMFKDIEAHLNPCPPEVKTLLKIFENYRETFYKM